METTTGKKILAFNWKQHGSLSLLQEVAQAVDEQAVISQGYQLLFFVPAPYLQSAQRLGNVGIQNISAYEQGAYTGEIGATMARDIGAMAALIGHSERRQYFHEDHEVIGEKIQQAVTAEIQPVLCIGETLEEYQAGSTTDVLLSQLEGIALPENIIIAYEPRWAIGTGLAATEDHISNAHQIIKAFLNRKQPSHGEKIPVLYGGSVNASNIQQHLSTPGVDGCLIGGASVQLSAFREVLDQCKRYLS